MKTLLKVCFSLASLLFLSSPGWAATSARYRIDLQDGSRVYARDLPVRRGTILTFHQHPGGALTGVPAELVLRVEPGSGAQAVAPKTRPKLQGGPSSGLEAGEIFVVGPAEGLKPGEVLVLGPTGEGGTVVSQQPPGVAAGANGGMGAPPLGAYGGNVNTNGTLLTGPNGLPVAPSSTDLSRAPAAQGLGQTAAAPNGFPATSAPTTIGPDGFPVLSPGVPGSSAPAATTVPVPVIGPNGTPVLAQPGAPGTAAPVIGPNGTPVLVQPGAPGTAAPVIGPNGTPVLAPPGAPGTAAPVIGPNGTPVLAPPGAPGAAPPAPAGPGGPPSN